jgi:hypothetical protein
MPGALAGPGSTGVGGPVWGWDGLIDGQRSILRLLPEQRSSIAVLTNFGTGRAMYRSTFPDLMDAYFGVRMPALRLEPFEPSRGAAGDL